MTIRNHPTMSDLMHIPVDHLAALPAEVLAVLQDEAEEALRLAKAAKDRLDGALLRRYGDTSGAARLAAGKDTGTVRFDDGPVTVVAELPKKVDWDQATLADLFAHIRAEGQDPAEYIEVAYRVSERRYNAWPSHIQSAFEDARTVRFGKPTFRLLLINEATS